MKTLRWSLLALAASPAWASYQYYLTDSLASVDAAKWSTSGTVSPSAAGLAAPNSNGGSLLSRVPIPDGSSEAEVAITVSWPVPAAFSPSSYSLRPARARDRPVPAPTWRSKCRIRNSIPTNTARPISCCCRACKGR